MTSRSSGGGSGLGIIVGALGVVVVILCGLIITGHDNMFSPSKTLSLNARVPSFSPSPTR